MPKFLYPRFTIRMQDKESLSSPTCSFFRTVHTIHCIFSCPGIMYPFPPKLLDDGAYRDINNDVPTASAVLVAPCAGAALFAYLPLRDACEGRKVGRSADEYRSAWAAVPAAWRSSAAVGWCESSSA